MLQDKTCLLTLYEEGALSKKTGLDLTIMDTGRRKYEFSKRMQVPSEVKRTLNLSESFVTQSISDDGSPSSIRKDLWRRMSDTQRLRANVNDLALSMKAVSFKLEIL
jgi:hypothetical protein